VAADDGGTRRCLRCHSFPRHITYNRVVIWEERRSVFRVFEIQRLEDARCRRPASRAPSLAPAFPKQTFSRMAPKCEFRGQPGIYYKFDLAWTKRGVDGRRH